MALNISNRSIEEKAILASQITGKNKTATVEEALDYFLRHHRPHNCQSASNIFQLSSSKSFQLIKGISGRFCVV